MQCLGVGNGDRLALTRVHISIIEPFTKHDFSIYESHS